MNEFLEQFLIEGRELVQQSTEDLLALEEEPQDQARLDSVFRGFHTLKGLAGIVEFAAMSRLLHAAENSLSAIRSGHRPVTPEAISDYLACLDQTVQWFDNLERDDQLPSVPDEAVDALVALFDETAMDGASAGETPSGSTPDWIEPLLAAHPDRRDAARVAVRYRPDRDCFFRGEDPLTRLEVLPGLLAVELKPNDAWPPLDELDPFACNLTVLALAGDTPENVGAAWRGAPGQVEIIALDPMRSAAGLRPALPPEILAILEDQLRLATEDAGEGFVGRFGSAGQVSVNLLRHAGWVAEAEALRQAVADGIRLGEPRLFTQLLQDFLHAPSARSDTETAAAASSLPRPDEIAIRALRVEVERVDVLVRLAGELSVLKNALGHASRLAQEGTDPTTLGALLSEQHALLDRLVQELQRSVLGIRVLPLQHVFRRFPRLVREMASDLGKSVRVVTEGEATEADKAIIEALAEPLVHVLRNAVGHGIETAEGRRAAGKDPTATILLHASRDGDRVVVDGEDDGAGIDIAGVRASAEARGIAAAEAIAAMTEDEVIDLIFMPGLSTAASITEVSGRGVGMDAVRSAIERLGGRVEIASRRGEGTRVRFRMPFDVIMSRVQTLEAGGQMFGVPLDVVVEMVRLARDHIVQVGAAKAFVWRERTIPLIDLAEVLSLPDGGRRSRQANVIITSTAGQLAALEVDRFGEQLEVMLKPMEGLLAGLPGIVGTTLLGDGRVLIVLDMQEVLQ